MPQQIVQIQSTIQWNVTEHGKGYVAVATALGLTMSGENLDDLKSNINETLQLMMVDLVQSGEFEAFLHAHGWQKVGQVVDPATPPQFVVPFSLIFNNAKNGQARATRQ